MLDITSLTILLGIALFIPHFSAVRSITLYVILSSYVFHISNYIYYLLVDIVFWTKNLGSTNSLFISASNFNNIPTYNGMLAVQVCLYIALLTLLMLYVYTKINKRLIRTKVLLLLYIISIINPLVILVSLFSPLVFNLILDSTSYFILNMVTAFGNEFYLVVLTSYKFTGRYARAKSVIKSKRKIASIDLGRCGLCGVFYRIYTTYLTYIYPRLDFMWFTILAYFYLKTIMF